MNVEKYKNILERNLLSSVESLNLTQDWIFHLMSISPENSLSYQEFALLEPSQQSASLDFWANILRFRVEIIRQCPKVLYSARHKHGFIGIPDL